MPSDQLNRRDVITTGLIGLVLTALPRSAFALTEAGAKALVVSVVNDITRVINSGKSEKMMIRDFERIFQQYADVPIMARYVLGADARSASPSQLKQFSKAFQGYIANKYGHRFREFIGGEVIVQKARKIRPGYEVRTSVKLQGSSPFEVTFLVSDKSGRDRFFNIFIEGVNMLLTERTEIGAMLDARGRDLNLLIRDMSQNRAG